MPLTQNTACENCLYRFEDYELDETTGEHLLQCRRYPPQVYGDEGEAFYLFPLVREHEWCGEFKEMGK